MKLHRTARTALIALSRNKTRAALTTLGIVIGIAAVIAMMEIGEGSAHAIQQTIASMGANSLLIFPGAAASGGISFGAGSVLTLTPQDCQAIARDCPAVAAVAPIVRARTQVIYGGRNWVPQHIYGTTPAYLRVRDWQVAEGQPFTDHDVRTAATVCVLGTTIVKQLFGNEDPIDKEIRIQNTGFKVLGVLRSKGASMMGMDQDDVVLAPWTAIKFRVAGGTSTGASSSTSSSSSSTTSTTTAQTGSNTYPGSEALYPEQSATQQMDTPAPARFTNVDLITLAATGPAEIPTAIDEVAALLRERHHIRPGEPDDFNIRDMTEMTAALSSTTALMTKLLLAVALISLIVGGVGIMNIMLVSVTERTREIGLRMAVGAKARDIMQQFLVEAVILCAIGGLAGIVLGRIISLLVSAILHWPTETSVTAVVASVAVSVTVGLAFGFYPAFKASRLDPIEALRYE